MIAASHAEGSRAVVTGHAVAACSGRRAQPNRVAEGQGGYSEAHTRLVDRPTHRRGWLSVAEVHTDCMQGERRHSGRGLTHLCHTPRMGRCAGVTRRGQACRNRAGRNGFCHMHGGGHRGRTPRLRAPSPRRAHSHPQPSSARRPRRRSWLWRLWWFLVSWFEWLRGSGQGRRSPEG